MQDRKEKCMQVIPFRKNYFTRVWNKKNLNFLSSGELVPANWF